MGLDRNGEPNGSGPKRSPLQREQARAWLARKSAEDPDLSHVELTALLNAANPELPPVGLAQVGADLRIVKERYLEIQRETRAEQVARELALLNVIIREAMLAYHDDSPRKVEIVQELTDVSSPVKLEVAEDTPPAVRGLVAETLKAIQKQQQRDRRRSELRLEERERDPAFLTVALKAGIQRAKLTGAQPPEELALYGNRDREPLTIRTVTYHDPAPAPAEIAPGDDAELVEPGAPPAPVDHGWVRNLDGSDDDD